MWHGPGVTQAEPDRGLGRDNADVAAPLDSLFIDAALGPLRRLVPGRAGLRMARRLAARPGVVARRAATTTGELAKIVVGTSELAPDQKDRRFTDPAWAGNPLLRRLLQAYLAASATTRELLDDADLEWRDRERMKFVTDNVIEALSPSNAPLANPAALKAALDTGGRSYLRGAANFVRDMSVPPRVPSMVDREAFNVGLDLAITPGEVVLRTEVFELIQYSPQTERVRKIPMLLVPPTINKYYIADLGPGRSMVEYFVRSGQQVFLVSWRNPGAEHADWGLDTYVAAVLEAMSAVENICQVDQTVLFSLCAGGIISSLLLGHLVDTGQEDRLAGFALGVTLLDQSRAGRCPRCPAPNSSRWPPRNHGGPATWTVGRWPRCSPGCGRAT